MFIGREPPGTTRERERTADDCVAEKEVRIETARLAGRLVWLGLERGRVVKVLADIGLRHVTWHQSRTRGEQRV